MGTPEWELAINQRRKAYSRVSWSDWYRISSGRKGVKGGDLSGYKNP